MKTYFKMFVCFFLAYGCSSFAMDENKVRQESSLDEELSLSIEEERKRRQEPTLDERFSLASLSLADSYTPNLRALSPLTLEDLGREKISQTDPKYPSSPAFLKVAYNALGSVGHPCPRMVIVMNNPYSVNCACLRNADSARCMNLVEKNLILRKEGAMLGCILHEAAHIRLKHYYLISSSDRLYFKKTQAKEREADRIAAEGLKCSACSREYAEFFLTLNTESPYKAWTIKEMESRSLQELAIKYTWLKKASQARRETHPLPVERAMFMYMHSLENKDKTCSFHSPFQCGFVKKDLVKLDKDAKPA